jgi:hypothetical protein
MLPAGLRMNPGEFVSGQFIAAQQRIADLHRAADHNRLLHTATSATSATSSHAGPAPRHAAAAAPVSFLRWLRRRLA